MRKPTFAAGCCHRKNERYPSESKKKHVLLARTQQPPKCLQIVFRALRATASVAFLDGSNRVAKAESNWIFGNRDRR